MQTMKRMQTLHEILIYDYSYQHQLLFFWVHEQTITRFAI